MDNTHHIITATSNVGSTLRLPCFHHPGVSAVGRLMVGMDSAHAMIGLVSIPFELLS
jgi:hypothetical protein